MFPLSSSTKFGVFLIAGGMAGLAIGLILYKKLDGGMGDYVANRTITSMIAVSSAAVVVGLLLLL